MTVTLVPTIFIYITEWSFISGHSYLPLKCPTPHHLKGSFEVALDDEPIATPGDRML